MIVFSFFSLSLARAYDLVKIKNDERDVKSAYICTRIYTHTLSRSFIHIIICLAARLKEMVMVVSKMKKNLSFFLSSR
jgi:hypothetical protein